MEAREYNLQTKSKDKVITEAQARSLVIKSLYFPKKGSSLHQDIQKAIAYEHVMFYAPNIQQQTYQRQSLLTHQQQQKHDDISSRHRTLTQSTLNKFQQTQDKQLQESESSINNNDHLDIGLDLVERIKQDTQYAQFDYRIYEEIKVMRKELCQERAMRNLANIMDQPRNDSGSDQEGDGDVDDDGDQFEMSMSISNMMGGDYNDNDNDQQYQEQMIHFRQSNNINDEVDERQQSNLHYYEDNSQLLQRRRNDDDDDYNIDSQDKDNYHQDRYMREEQKRLDDDQIEEILEAQQRKANQRSDQEENQMIFNKQSLDKDQNTSTSAGVMSVPI